MYSAIREWIFENLEAEQSHNLALEVAGRVGNSVLFSGLMRELNTMGGGREVELFGLRFANPVGLAAGFDKDARAWRGLWSLGFGHIEVGTVTPGPQPGNEPPRMFRLPEDASIINRLGFPSAGANQVARNLSGARPPGLILGVNLGKNKDTPLDRAVLDYVALIQCFAALADYLVINISSPNTPGLRKLQGKDYIHHLLRELCWMRDVEADVLGEPVPLLVKLSPDMSDEELDDVLDAILAHGIDGVIATNTTTERRYLRSPQAQEAGGLSGAALTRKSTSMIAAIHERTNGELPIIGVGGIMTADDAMRKLDAGASLVQVYSGLIYTGPGLVRDIIQASRHLALR